MQKTKALFPRKQLMRKCFRTKYKRRLTALLKHPFFWVLTVCGNSMIIAGTLSFYIFETPYRKHPLSLMDCLLWSTGIVTTIGYSNNEAFTFAGKLTILILMLGGTLFLWSYMAFLVSALITPELSSLENDIHQVEKELEDLQRN
ncbi:MAG: potassium channel family protein [Bdellovibrionales bacterium]|nr:potassium channel family protein [Bdellovibrionales bacterium]